MKILYQIDRGILQGAKWFIPKGVKSLFLLFIIGISMLIINREAIKLLNDIEPAHANIQITKVPENPKTIQEDVWDILDGYGLTFQEKIKAVGIITCESNWNPFAIGVNKNGSKDLGLWQTNEVYQKITRGCAFDYVCQTKYVMENIYLVQKNWSAWMCSR